MAKNEVLNTAYNVTAAFVESIPKKERKKYGQFFTSKKTAEFMALVLNIYGKKNCAETGVIQDYGLRRNYK